MAEELCVGEIAEWNEFETFTLKVITWKILNFLSLLRSAATEVRSPEFSFANGTWDLRMRIPGETRSDLFVEFMLHRLESLEAEQVVCIECSFETSRGEELECSRDSHNFTADDNKIALANFVTLSELNAKLREIVPGDTPVLVCTMHTKSTAVKAASREKEVATPITNSENDMFTKATPDENFIPGYMELLQREGACDVTLQVRGKKFEAHRAILAARSSVLASTLGNDMKKNNTGLLHVPDCDPECFPDFLCFLYCGSVESITSQNACSLYRAADKYEVENLKSDCLVFMKSHIELDNICDVIALAWQHDETDLIKQATDFFVENALKIVVTDKWQLFLTENPIQGNKLIIKALSAHKSSNP